MFALSSLVAQRPSLPFVPLSAFPKFPCLYLSPFFFSLDLLYLPFPPTHSLPSCLAGKHFRDVRRARLNRNKGDKDAGSDSNDNSESEYEDEDGEEKRETPDQLARAENEEGEKDLATKEEVRSTHAAEKANEEDAVADSLSSLSTSLATAGQLSGLNQEERSSGSFLLRPV